MPNSSARTFLTETSVEPFINVMVILALASAEPVNHVTPSCSTLLIRSLLAIGSKVGAAGSAPSTVALVTVRFTKESASFPAAS